MTEFDQTTDAQEWARAFMYRFMGCSCGLTTDDYDGPPVIDEGLLITWFANAIERGRTAGREEAESVWRGAIADEIDNVDLREMARAAFTAIHDSVDDVQFTEFVRDYFANVARGSVSPPLEPATTESGAM